MINQLADIKRLRKKYNLTQKDLSLQSGVSQSLIAKIEAGNVEPTYSKTISLFQVLEHHRHKDETKAKDIMTRKVITVNKDNTVEAVIKMMKKNNISQIPVLENERVCGLVTEGILLEKTIEHSGRVNNLTAEDIMVEVPPMISPQVGIRTLLELLRESSAILVIETGVLKGIISKSDLLGRIE